MNRGGTSPPGAGSPCGQDDREIRTIDQTVSVDVRRSGVRSPVAQEGRKVCAVDDAASIEVADASGNTHVGDERTVIEQRFRGLLTAQLKDIDQIMIGHFANTQRELRRLARLDSLETTDIRTVLRKAPRSRARDRGTSSSSTEASSVNRSPASARPDS